MGIALMSRHRLTSEVSECSPAHRLYVVRLPIPLVTSMTEKIINNRHEQLEMIEKTEMDIKTQLGDMRQRFMDFFGQMESRILDKMAQARIKEGGALQTEILAICMESYSNVS
jgi:hypothetical protein